MQRESILLVGEELSRVRAELVARGYRVWAATSVREASALLEVYHPKLIIMTDVSEDESREWGLELESDPSTRGITLVSVERAAELLAL